MSDKEVMPLIADECYSANKIQNCHPRTCCAEAQRDADRKVLESETQRLHDRYGDIIVSKYAELKEWREKEADEWKTLLRHLVLLEESPKVKGIIKAVNKRVAELRKGE